MNKQKNILILLVIVFLNTSFSQQSLKAETPNDGNVTKLTLYPAAESNCPLQYSFYPNPFYLKSGNAALIYNQALANAPRERNDKIGEMLEVPFQELSVDEANKLLPPYRAAIEQFQRAATYRDCDWMLEYSDGVDMLLFGLSDYRKMSRALLLDMNVKYNQGDIDGAIKNAQACFALSNKINQGGLIINSLVGIAISAFTVEQTIHLGEKPGSPNFYWAYRLIPDDYLDMTNAFLYETECVLTEFPYLKTIRTDILTNEQAEQLLDMFCVRINDLERLLADEQNEELFSKEKMLKSVKQQKKYLLKAGYDKKKVDAYPPAQIILVQLIEQFQSISHSMTKWTLLPMSSQSYKEMKQISEQVEKEQTRVDKRNLLIFFPSITRAYFYHAKSKRTIEMACTIEALRIYAAEHNQWPKILDDVTMVPIYNDPVTGQPFVYKRTSPTNAILEAPKFPQEEQESKRPIFELTLAK